MNSQHSAEYLAVGLYVSKTLVLHYWYYKKLSSLKRQLFTSNFWNTGLFHLKLSCDMTKPTKWLCTQAKTQISLGIRPDWSESSLSAWRKPGSLTMYWAHSEDSDQAGWMPRLIRVFAGRNVTLLVLSCRGSNPFQWWMCRKTLPNLTTVNFLNILTPKEFGVITKIWTMRFYHRVMRANGADRMANSAAPDQLAAVWSGSTLFVHTYLSENLGSLQ